MMKIKKGKVLISITYLNGDYTNNLYCREIHLREDKERETETVVISLEIIEQSFNKDDFGDLIDSIDILETISLDDNYTYNGIRAFFNQKASRLSLRHQLELTLKGNLFIFDIKFRNSNSERFEIGILR